MINKLLPFDMNGFLAAEAEREAERAQLDEACPGCGCLPGDGVTAGCAHPAGCGFFAEAEKTAERQAGTQQPAPVYEFVKGAEIPASFIDENDVIAAVAHPAASRFEGGGQTFILSHPAAGRYVIATRYSPHDPDPQMMITVEHVISYLPVDQGGTEEKADSKYATAVAIMARVAFTGRV